MFKKFIILFSFLFLNSNFLAYAVQPYYRLDFEKLDEARAVITQLKEDVRTQPADPHNYVILETCRCFLSACDLAKRPTEEAEISKVARDTSYALAFEPYRPQTGGYLYRSSPISPARTLDQMLAVIPPAQHPVFHEAAEDNFKKASALIPLYIKYVEFYGPWREWRFRTSAIGLPLKTDPLPIREKKALVFNTLLKTGFIATHQVDLEDGLDLDDPAPMVYDFLGKNPQIDELRLGDEKTLCFADHRLLGAIREGWYGMRAFSEEDIDPKIMRISQSFDENNDIPVDAHNPLFWEALLGAKGEGSLARIKDLSWYVFGSLQNREDSEESVTARRTVAFIHKALQPGGEFSIWDHAFEGRDSNFKQTGKLSEDESLKILIENITSAGFVYLSEQSQKDTLVFKKP